MTIRWSITHYSVKPTEKSQFVRDNIVICVQIMWASFVKSVDQSNMPLGHCEVTFSTKSTFAFEFNTNEYERNYIIRILGGLCWRLCSESASKFNRHIEVDCCLRFWLTSVNGIRKWVSAQNHRIRIQELASKHQVCHLHGMACKYVLKPTETE